MARLSDLGIETKNVDNRRVIYIQGKPVPVVLSMETMEHIAEVYDDDYAIFERDLNNMIKRSDGELNTGKLKSSDLKIMRSLIYAMVRSGGIECTPEELSTAIGFTHELLDIFGQCMEIFSKQRFQVEDLKKSRKPQDFKKTSKKVKNQRNRNPKR